MSIVLQAAVSIPASNDWPIMEEDFQRVCEFVRMDWDAKSLGAELLSLGLIEPVPAWRWTDNGLELITSLVKLEREVTEPD